MVAVFQPVFVFPRRLRTSRRRTEAEEHRFEKTEFGCKKKKTKNKTKVKKKKAREEKGGKKPGGTQGSNG